MTSRPESKQLTVGVSIAVAVLALLTIAMAYASINQTSSQTMTPASSSSQQMGSLSGNVAVGGCSTSVNSSENAFSLRASVDSPAMLCVRYFYYNQTAPTQLDTSSIIKVFGWYLNASSLYLNDSSSRVIANSNFTMTTMPSTISIGGPTNENEGVQVNYAITANFGTSGTYDVSVGQYLLPGGIGCSGQFLLTVGNGQPDYASMAPSLMCSHLPTNNSLFLYTPGVLLVQIVGATNSSAIAGEDL